MRGARPRLTPDQVVEMRAAAQAGTTRAALSLRYGVGESAIGNYLRGDLQSAEIVAVSPTPIYLNAGRRPRLTPQQKISLVCKYRAGSTRAELGREFGIAHKTVSQYLRDTHKNPALWAVRL